VANPVAADEAKLVARACLYRKHCMLCHGDLEYPKSPLADLLNPPPPQFMNDKVADMPENQNFYILQHGIAYKSQAPRTIQQCEYAGMCRARPLRVALRVQ
jgi:hypothetical protein